MPVNLETLELTPEGRRSCKDVVERMAYFNWLDAGGPDGSDLEFWLKAERDWIEHDYVPDRALDGTRPQSDDEPFSRMAGENREEPIPQNHAVALAKR